MTPMNGFDQYAEEGRRAARALYQDHDSAGSSFHWEWLTRALALEDRSIRPVCRKTWEDAYREEASIIRGGVA